MRRFTSILVLLAALVAVMPHAMGAALTPDSKRQVTRAEVVQRANRAGLRRQANPSQLPCTQATVAGYTFRLVDTGPTGTGSTALYGVNTGSNVYAITTSPQQSLSTYQLLGNRLTLADLNTLSFGVVQSNANQANFAEFSVPADRGASYIGFACSINALGALSCTKNGVPAQLCVALDTIYVPGGTSTCATYGATVANIFARCL